MKQLVKVSMKEITPYSKNEKVHTNDNLELIKMSLDTVGYVTPIVVDEDFVILAGHGRYEVMKDDPKYKKIEVLQLTGLTETDKKKFRLFDNQTARTGHYNNELLFDTIKEIMEDDSAFNIGALGIEGLAETFSQEIFNFDLGKKDVSEAEGTKKVLIIVTEDEVSVTELLKSNNIDYIWGIDYAK